MSIPDAPWIVEAETNGPPCAERVPICPVCGAREPDRLFLDRRSGEPWCCDVCFDKEVDTIDPWDWLENHPDDSERA